MQPLQFPRSLGHQQPHFPVAGVEAQRDGCAIFGTQPAMRAQNQKLRIAETRSLPAHARVLAEPEEIPRGLGQQHLGRQRQRALRPARVRGHRAQVKTRRLQNRFE